MRMGPAVLYVLWLLLSCVTCLQFPQYSVVDVLHKAYLQAQAQGETAMLPDLLPLLSLGAS